MDKSKYKLDDRVYYNGVRHWIFKEPTKSGGYWWYEIRVDDGNPGIAPSERVREDELEGTRLK